MQSASQLSDFFILTSVPASTFLLFFFPLLSCHAFFSHSRCINHYSLYTGGLRRYNWITQGEHSRSYLNTLSASVLKSL